MTTYGEHLTKSQLPLVNKQLVQASQFLLEFREYIKEKSQLEKEYSNKLENLIKKYRNKKIFNLSNINRDPFAPSHGGGGGSFDAISLSGTISSVKGNEGGIMLDENSTLLQGLNNLFSDTEKIAGERAVLSEYLVTDIADPLKMLANKVEEERKKLFNFSKKITDERDKIYNEKDKLKSKYDESCNEVITSQIKQERTMETKVLDKLQKQYYQDVIDRNNNKNLYILAVEVANQHKNKHYTMDVPELLNFYQTLNEYWMEHIKSFWFHYIQLESNCFNDSKLNLDNLKLSVNKVDKKLESKSFINNNPSNWAPPGDFQFTSFGQFAEDNQLIDEYSSKVYLFNKMNKNEMELNEMKNQILQKQEEVEQLKLEYSQFDLNPSLENNGEQIYEKLSETWRELVILKNQELTSLTENQLISNSIGQYNLNGIKHDFKTTSFTIPTTCDYCENSIWGLNRHGSTCKDCKYNCHANCEFKVPPNCTQIKGGAKSIRKEQMDFNTLKDKTAPFLKNSTSDNLPSHNLRQPIPDQFIQPQTPEFGGSNLHSPVLSTPISLTHHSSIDSQHSVGEINNQSHIQGIYPMAKVLYSYEASDDNELSITAGTMIEITEGDDGSGWVKAMSNGNTGLVPGTYIEIEGDQSNIPDHVNAPSEVIQVRVLYDFEAQSEYDLNICVGDIITLTKAEDDSGWSEGTLNGVTGQFPSNYVEYL
ncbi:hypothetical protein K502DRAFT_324908 [Neoconidiobolus thromboides FSU 785]|nr:hypothetical protein K502DRAFT_324908 [Neoconidiobolus thromboides FSU 785]